MSITQPAVMRRLLKEIGELQKTPPEGLRIQTSEENILDVVGIIEGPDGTPYAGGYFKVGFQFTEEFPAAPPRCRMLTKIFHPNVSAQGEICVNTLKKDWKATYGIQHILVTVRCLLIYPNPESALDEEAGKLLLEDYDSYCSRARLITSVHATPKVKPVEFQTPSAPQADSTSRQSSPTPSTVTSAPLQSPPTALPAISANRKSGSPSPAIGKGLKSPTGVKERHVSPSPLSTADANVRASLKPTTAGMESLGVSPAGLPTGTKAVKRAATGSANSGAEKRKKALKRL
ncbi:ubiquitin-conjugating enzyme/RWD-like protein [Flagelloscypha sp. PMI_526]|nr:ubiquitin-conjugating enzyme/RWD-like protein [Flagelloscypha sp. PMI_526]